VATVRVAVPADVPTPRLLPYFMLIGFAAFAVVTVLLALLFRRVALGHLLEVAERRNVTLTQAFSNSVWPEFAPVLRSLEDAGVATLAAHPALEGLRGAVLAQMRATSVVRVKVYDRRGRTVFSTQTDQIGADQSRNPGVIAALGGAVTSALTHRDTFNAFDGEIEDRDVLASYVPIRRGDSLAIDAVLELYDDVTPLVRRMERSQWILVFGVTTTLACLFAVLSLVVRRTERAVLEAAEVHRRVDAMRLQLERQVRQRQKMEAVGTLAAGFAHDFNNVVWAIQACGEMALRDLAAESPAREKVEEMCAAARSGAELVNQILSFSRRDEEWRQPVRVRDAAEEAIAGVTKGRSFGVRLYCRSDDGAFVTAGDGEMQQLVGNLVRNALQAVPLDGGVVEVELDSIEVRAGDLPAYPELRCGPYVRLTVRDNGCGMDQATLDRIFDPFFTTKQMGDGIGLGLAIVHGIATGLDGAVRVRSVPQQGSTFEVTLPRSAGEPVAATGDSAVDGVGRVRKTA
jgi:signal transduction histidine kinase